MLIVAGVDGIGRAGIEAMSRLAEDAGVRLILMFSRLRDDAVSVIGASDSSTIFMIMGNMSEAETAAKFIGRHHVFRLGQVSEQLTVSSTDTAARGWTVQHGSSRSEQVGEATATNRGGSTSISRGVTETPGSIAVGIGGRGLSVNHVGRSRSWNRNHTIADSWAESVTRSTSTTVGRSSSVAHTENVSRAAGVSVAGGSVTQSFYDYIVEPTRIQNLFPTTFILCDRVGNRVVAGDCNPAIAGLGRVSPVPFSPAWQE